MTCSIEEAQFTGLLHDLGVDTAGLSFGWLLEDDDSGILQWFHKNICTDNALAYRESQRYNDLLANGSFDNQSVEDELSKILLQFDGLVSPTDGDGLSALENDILMLKEKIQFTKEQNVNLEYLENINEKSIIKESREIKRLQEEQLVTSIEYSATLKECTELANDIESKKNKLVEIVHKTLDFYGNSISANIACSQLLACGPVEKYLQSRKLFQSYVNVCLAEFGSKQPNAKYSDNNRRMSLSSELNRLAEKLHVSVSDYINYKAKHRTVLKQLQENPERYNMAQINLDIAKCQSAISILNTDIDILKKQSLNEDVANFVDEQCHLVWQAEGQHLLSERRLVYSQLCSLMDHLQEMLNLDDLLYFGMKRNCTMVEDAIQFDIDVNEYIEEERIKIRARVDYMKNIQLELSPTDGTMDHNNPMTKAIQDMFAADTDMRPSQLMSLLTERQKEIEESQKAVVLHFLTIHKKQALVKSSTDYIHNFIWDGYTRQPNLFNLSVTAFIEKVLKEKSKVDKLIKDTVKIFAKQKDDKSANSALWIWFLTNERKLLQVMENMRNNISECRPFK